MGYNKKYFRVILLVVLCVTALFVVSCSSSRSNARTAARYTKQRTRYNPKWNATTSQSTTYYMKKKYNRGRTPSGATVNTKNKRYTPTPTEDKKSTISKRHRQTHNKHNNLKTKRK